MILRIAIVAALLAVVAVSGNAFDVDADPQIHANIPTMHANMAWGTGVTAATYSHGELDVSAPGPPGGTAWLDPHYWGEVHARSHLNTNNTGPDPAYAYIDYEVEFLRTLEVSITTVTPASHYEIEIFEDFYFHGRHIHHWDDASEQVFHYTESIFNALPIGVPAFPTTAVQFAGSPSGATMPETHTHLVPWTYVQTSHFLHPFVPAPPPGGIVTQWFDCGVNVRGIAETDFPPGWGTNNANFTAHSGGSLWAQLTLAVTEF